MTMNNSTLRIITGFCIAASLWLLFFYFPPIILSALCLIAMFGMLCELKSMARSSKEFFMLALWYPIIPNSIIIYFNHTPDYRHLLFYLFAIVLSFDTGSYFSGKLCNKFWTTHKIIPTISPGKSWEGFFGGLIKTILLMYLIIYHRNQTMSLSVIALTIIICCIAFAGDIFESYLKRRARIKDSGIILPGHGGLLDRFDAILFASYFFFILKNYLVTIL